MIFSIIHIFDKNVYASYVYPLYPLHISLVYYHNYIFILHLPNWTFWNSFTKKMNEIITQWKSKNPLFKVWKLTASYFGINNFIHMKLNLTLLKHKNKAVHILMFSKWQIIALIWKNLCFVPRRISIRKASGKNFKYVLRYRNLFLQKPIFVFNNILK